MLSEKEAASLRWCAALGEMSGWDLEYRDSEGRLTGVEVKGTKGKRFAGVILNVERVFCDRANGGPVHPRTRDRGSHVSSDLPGHRHDCLYPGGYSRCSTQCVEVGVAG
jgi:hypothetical protein